MVAASGDAWQLCGVAPAQPAICGHPKTSQKMALEGRSQLKVQSSANENYQ
jgi:hypothetical protein